MNPVELREQLSPKEKAFVLSVMEWIFIEARLSGVPLCNADVAAFLEKSLIGAVKWSRPNDDLNNH